MNQHYCLSAVVHRWDLSGYILMSGKLFFFFLRDKFGWNKEVRLKCDFFFFPADFIEISASDRGVFPSHLYH